MENEGKLILTEIIPSVKNMIFKCIKLTEVILWQLVLVGLGITCSPRDPRFAGSNPAEVDGFFQDVKILSASPLGGTSNWGPQV